jgi:putative ATP-dependent endonuclease of OLD family
MHISEIRLWNFRKYGKISSNLNREPDLILLLNKGLNVLIGENDSGKSTILDAIKLVLKTHAYEWIKVEDTDFYTGADKLKIEIHFSGISNDEGKHFIEWCGWAEEEIEKDGKLVTELRPKLILIYQAEIRDNRIIPSDIKAGMDGVGHLLNAEAREYLKCTYLKALRDADSELTAKKNSRLSEILQKHQLFFKQKGVEHEFEIDFKKINNKIENHFKGSKNDKRYNEQIKIRIDEYLEKFIDNKTISLFSLGRPEIKNILEKLNLGIVGKNNLGLGTMNRLFMAAELLHLKREWNGLKLCMIEELEAHLHPQAQMKIIGALSEDAKNGIQFILTTHSPNIASKVHLESLIICKDNNVFPLTKNCTKLGEDNYTYLERFLDVTKSNLFFAKGVIIVEGWSEEILMPELAIKLGHDLTAKEVSIVNVASTAYLHFGKIFLRKDDKEMKVPVAIVADLDIREYEREPKVDLDGKIVKKQYNYIKQNIKNINSKRSQREKDILESKDAFVTPYVSKLWTFEWCLLKSDSLGNHFKETLKSIHSDTFKNCDSEESWEKSLAQILLSKSIKKTEIAYQLSEKIKKENSIIIEKKDTIFYLVSAINHACKYD